MEEEEKQRDMDKQATGTLLTFDGQTCFIVSCCFLTRLKHSIEIPFSSLLSQQNSGRLYS